MFKTINALSIAISLSLVVVMQPQALSGTVGAITSWGHNDYGQVSGTPTGTGFTHIAAGSYHSLAFTIPEPHTLLLASLASMGLTLRRRRSAR